MFKSHKKTLCRLVMIPVYCLCGVLQDPVCAQHKTLKVTLHVKRRSIDSILFDIKAQTGLSPMYNLMEVKPGLIKKRNLTVTDKPVADVLQELLMPLHYTFEISNQSIIITKGTPANAGKMNDADTVTEYRQLAGTVTDDAGRPVGGVNVVIKGRRLQTVTDTEGKFRFRQVAAQNTLLVYGSGYAPKEVPVDGKDRVDIILHPAVNTLDETVVLGHSYNLASDRFLTCNSYSIKSRDIANQPVSNPLQALEGWVPGLFIEQTTGLPGSGIKVHIQGQNSLTKTNDPLYIVDGVPFLSRLPFTYSDIQGGSGSNGVDLAGVQAGSGSPLDYINPEDIDSIYVLRDVSAAAQYGSRAANGAIVIITRKGADSAARVQVTFENGWATVTRKIQLLNTAQYIGLRTAAYHNDGLPVPDRSSPADETNLDLTHYDPERYTNWQQELIGGTAQFRNLHTAVSGSTGHTRYQVSVGYRRQTTVFPGALGDRKTSIHTGLQRGSDSSRFRIMFNGNYVRGNTMLIAEDLTKDAMSLAPNAPALYKPDGTLNWDVLPDGEAGWSNPLAHSQPYHNITSNLLAGITASYRLPYGLQLSNVLGYNYLHAQDELSQPLSAYTPQERVYRDNRVQMAISGMHTWSVEPQLSYYKQSGNVTFNTTIGYTWQEHIAHREAIDGSGFAAEKLMEDIAFAAYKDTVSSSAYYRFSAVYGTFSSIWNNRYILSLSIRQDHSSRLGKTERSHTFGTVSAAWIFSDEIWAKENLPFLSFGKLKTGYCITGNDGLLEKDTYVYNTLLYRPPQPGWEKIQKVYLGLDLGIARNKLFVGINYYNNRSANHLLERKQPVFPGIPFSIFSYGALVQNTGWELELHTKNITLGKYRWSADATLTVPRNKLLAFPGLQQTAYAYDYVAGQSLNLVRAYQFAGVDPLNGLNRITDRNGNISLPAVQPVPEDRVVNIDLNPRFYGGLHNCFTYGRFQLDVFFQFVKQKGPLYNWSYQPGLFSSTANTGNQPVAVLAAWQKPGDNTTVAKAISHFSDTTYASYINGQFSSAMFGDASYIRLRNLALSYQLPAMKWRHATAKIFVHAQNLLTITGYNSLDPETKSSVSLPPLRVITVGATITI